MQRPLAVCPESALAPLEPRRHGCGEGLGLRGSVAQ